LSEELAKPRNSERELKVTYFSSKLDYETAWRAMQDYTDKRDSLSDDRLWVLQHDPVFTQGQAGKSEHLLNTGDIPVVQVDRGGQVTYHGPGQLVIYVLFDIDRMGIGTRQFVRLIEQAMVQALKDFGVDSKADPEAPGVYVDGRKIGSIGLRIRKGRSFHGLSVNLDMDQSPWLRINPCGYQGLQMAQLRDYCPEVSITEFSNCLVDALSSLFCYRQTNIEVTDSL